VHVASIPITEVHGEHDHHVACVRADELARWMRRSGAPTAHDAGGAGEPMVAVHHLTRSTRLGGVGPWSAGASSRVSDVDLAAARGRTLAIVGESGCGKSTVAKVLSGLEIATAGGVTLDGVEVGALAVDARSAGVEAQAPDGVPEPR